MARTNPHPFRFLTLALVALGCAGPSIPAQSPPPAGTDLRSGPMLGYGEMREVLVWLQTDGPAEAAVEYWDSSSPGERFRTEPVLTADETAFTARFAIGLLEPGTTYHYRPVIDGRPVDRPYPMRFRTQPLWQWRTDPPAFTIALASCFYVNEAAYDRPGEPYGGEYEILEAVHAQRPDVMLWSGDNVYLREADWYSRSGVLHRYSHTRALPELQPLLASTHHYATWDDHDYGPNDSDRTFRDRVTSLQTFRLFWGNPSYGQPEFAGVTTMFQWADVDFFLLDNRFHRTPNALDSEDETILGDQQRQWLVEALASSQAPFKLVVIGNQVLNPVPTAEAWAAVAPEERQWLIDRITEEEIPGVVFLTGDRHFTELSRLDRPGTYPLYDLTISPLTAGPYPGARDEPNQLRVDGTFYGQRNFATLDFTGPRTDRAMTITVFDVEGDEVWSRTIQAAELRPPDA